MLHRRLSTFTVQFKEPTKKRGCQGPAKLGMVPPGEISRFAGGQTGILGVLLIVVAGAIMYIPSSLAFPLAASLLEAGASISAVATFITTLTMVGFVTLSLEIRELGRRLTVLRNAFSFAIALMIGLIIGGCCYEATDAGEEDLCVRLSGARMCCQRLALTVILVIPMGLAIEVIVRKEVI